MMYLSQIITLYTLNLYSTICQWRISIKLEEKNMKRTKKKIYICIEKYGIHYKSPNSVLGSFANLRKLT